MRIGRTLPPAAAPITFKDIFSGLKGICNGQTEIKRFESELTRHFKVSHSFLVSSGKAALTIILKSLHEQHPERNEVIIPAFTCYSVPSAILKAGLEIRLCDINPDTLDFDFDQLENEISRPCVLAVIPTHLFGMPADIGRIRNITTAKKVWIVEDAAQAMGGESNHQKLGTLGDVGFFSLGRGKALSTVEGGIILTNNPGLADRIARQMADLPEYSRLETLKLLIYAVILNIFMRPAWFWFPKALPFLKLGETLFEPDFSIQKLCAFQAGLSRGWEKRLKQITLDRQKAVRNWADLMSRCPSEKMQNIHLACQAKLRFPLKVTDAAALAGILAVSEQNGLGLMRAYPDSVNHIPQIRDRFRNMTFPKASAIAGQVLTLPVHHFMKAADIRKIKQILTPFFQKENKCLP
ncbi:MAG: DegT/DnrJ/EryC1/StrS family aminotransferase [Proteobacteria bacterium]|nr:DegT/DnrJ/EryC1/StrS family aminotransferase [Pseudomonadota bacterium]MBU1388713.1 DegT/DnrJ/EryC1/StrS family aminotransferase [Pseudomonadota bacterium]MBU1543054.1 DegT/DnrJ/EryC1/StrS family aminotransferase [Pseudomonadota bacterium]MBU2482824.1 DegT/DnrJ/EryC1/StrS family aminotransferase [Pseudomonadota bacterium]